MQSLAPNPSPTAARQRWWVRWFAPLPAIEPLREPAAIERNFARWRNRVLFSALAGYATFYFVRKNLAIAMPMMEKELGISKSDLGLFLTLHGLIYGVSKFANGFLGDRCNARAVMVTGLVASALLNILFGFSSAVLAFGIIWMLNGWFQGMGFPPCARLMTHWFPPSKLATKMTIWNTSHCVGAALVLVLCGALVSVHWRLCFFVPSAIALCGAAAMWMLLPDTPPSVGLPEVEGTQKVAGTGHDTTDFKALLLEKVFRNKYIWLFSAANFFVYTIRYAMLDWGPTMLSQSKGIRLSHTGWMLAAFEFFGLLGALLGGWMTDRFFGGRGARACTFYMFLSGLAILAFWKNSSSSPWVSTALLCGAGFFI